MRRQLSVHVDVTEDRSLEARQRLPKMQLHLDHPGTAAASRANQQINMPGRTTAHHPVGKQF
jgi:hypothetical protein